MHLLLLALWFRVANGKSVHFWLNRPTCPAASTYGDRMRLRPVWLVLIAAACGMGMTACGTESGTPTAGASAGYGATSPAASPGASGVLGILGVTANSPQSANSSRSATSRSRPTPTAHASSPAGARSTGPSPSTHPTSPSPSASATSGGSGGSVSFTVPSIPGDNVVSAYGSYTKINAAKVTVTVCAKQTGSAYSVGAIALAYNTSGASKNVGAVVLTGPGNVSCGTITFILYSAHLKVHAFIGGNNGVIAKTGPVLTLY